MYNSSRVHRKSKILSWCFCTAFSRLGLPNGHLSPAQVSFQSNSAPRWKHPYYTGLGKSYSARIPTSMTPISQPSQLNHWKQLQSLTNSIARYSWVSSHIEHFMFLSCSSRFHPLFHLVCRADVAALIPALWVTIRVYFCSAISSLYLK